jgi:uncharacterized membrane protein (UPF0127 family)
LRASFLAPLAQSPHHYSLWNERTNHVLARTLEAAFDSRTRNKGLLGRDGIGADSALILAPCSSIHTWFMRFAIDAAFVDRNGVVVKVARTMRPWHIAIALRAFAVVELPPGTLDASGTVLGDHLHLRRR